MKVFVPMSDHVLEEKRADEVKLVPFSPDFLIPAGKDRRPRNWISDNDYTAAIKRLSQTREFAPA